MIKGTPTKLVVNDYWRAAIVAGAKHLHLGQEDLADADLAEIRKAGLTLGISTHDDEELATALRAKPDYIALGPIFPTTLKSMRFAPQGIPKITEWKKRVGDIPLVAIGGIKFEQAAEIFAAGADFDRRRQRRHPERRPRCAGQTMARPSIEGGLRDESLPKHPHPSPRRKRERERSEPMSTLSRLRGSVARCADARADRNDNNIQRRIPNEHPLQPRHHPSRRHHRPAARLAQDLRHAG